MRCIWGEHKISLVRALATRIIEWSQLSIFISEMNDWCEDHGWEWMKKERKGEGKLDCVRIAYIRSESALPSESESRRVTSSSSSLMNTMQYLWTELPTAPHKYCNFVFTNITLSHHDLKEHQGLRSDLAQLKVFRTNTPLTSFLPKYWPPAAIGIV